MELAGDFYLEMPFEAAKKEPIIHIKVLCLLKVSRKVFSKAKSKEQLSHDGVNFAQDLHKKEVNNKKIRIYEKNNEISYLHH